MARAIEYGDWLRRAEERKLLLTAAEFKRLAVGRSYPIIPVDYVEFLAAELPTDYKIIHNQPCDPASFFLRFEGALVPLGTHREERCFVANGKGRAKRADANFHGAKLKLVPSDELEKAELCDSAEEPYLSVGSGDGYTRFMLVSLDRLRDLPPFYFTNGA